MRNRFVLATLAAAAMLAAVSARADEPPAPSGDGLSVSWSAFGTVGVTRSDQPWRFQRSIRDELTAERDTVFGAQLDLQFNPQWSATAQAKLAPSTHGSSHWDLAAAWAFAAWRPDNDWLLRMGKLRVPLLLRSEQLDVGQTYDEARLPSEIYSLAPTNDFLGVHATRTWPMATGDWSLEGYVGNSDLHKRFWIREAVPSPMPGAPNLMDAGARFTKVNVGVGGLVLSWRTPSLTARVGLHHARTRGVEFSDFTVRPVWMPLGPGIGYWVTNKSGPGMGVQPDTTNRIRNDLLTLGVEASLGGGWRVASEWLRLQQRDTEMGMEGQAGYLTLYRGMGAFTPYLTLAASRTADTTAHWQRQLDSTTVPAMVPGAALLNGVMRASADTVPTVRQQSLALGTSYALSPTSKLKFEWQHTQATQSLLVDVPAGEALDKPRHVNVLSASYSFVF